MVGLDNLIQIIISGLGVGCIYALVALGFTLIYKATEVVNFAQGELLMLGAFVAYTFIGLWGWQYWAGLIASMVVVAFLGFTIDAVILRRVIGQPQFAIVMLTIGLGFIFRAAATMIWGANSLVLPTPFFGQSLTLSGVSIPANTLAMVVGAILLCVLLSLFFSATRIGIAMQAAAQNQLAAYYMGIRVKVLFSVIWAISGATAALAGVLVAPATLIDTNLGFIGLKAFAAAILGGFGSVGGALIGGLVIGLLEQLASWYVPDIKDITAYIVLLAVLLVRPQGLLGAVLRKKV
ncbi:branched-chain amino acid ABC transporter permease [Martelella sp. FOR1707]